MKFRSRVFKFETSAVCVDTCTGWAGLASGGALVMCETDFAAVF
ncbi:hypothetical protein [uncultured Campylobacter sp.]|nr:hypothetical protein [uncultured Campylobacter sp.]